MYTTTAPRVPPASAVPPLDLKETGEIAGRFQSFDTSKNGYLTKPQLRNFLLEYFCPVDSPTQFLIDVIDGEVDKQGDKIDVRQAMNCVTATKTKVGTPLTEPIMPKANPFLAQQSPPFPTPYASTNNPFMQPNPFVSGGVHNVYAYPQPAYPSYGHLPNTPAPPTYSMPPPMQPLHGYHAPQYPSTQTPPSPVTPAPNMAVVPLAKSTTPAMQAPVLAKPPLAKSSPLTKPPNLKAPAKSPANPFAPSFKASPQAATPFASAPTKGSLSRGDSGTGLHYVSEQEKKAFVDFINSHQKLCQDPDLSHILPINANSDAIYTAVSDGALFCKYLNAIKPDIIAPGSIKLRPKNTFEKSENHMKAIAAAKKLGCSVVNIGPEDLIQGKPHLVMGLIWQLIKHDVLSKVSLREHPEIYQLTRDGSTSLKDISECAPEDVLLRWVNFHLKNAGHAKSVSNFSQDIKDCSAYTVLMHQISPQLCSLDPLKEPDLAKRAQMVMLNAQKLGCTTFLSTPDILNGNSRLNLAFLADLFNRNSALSMPSLEEFEMAKRQNATLSYILDDAEARLRQILSDQALAYELQQQEILLYREQKLREQRQLAEQEAMLLAQEQQERTLLEQQRRFKEMALRDQEQFAREEQLREESRYAEQRRQRQVEIDKQTEELRNQQLVLEDGWSRSGSSSNSSTQLAEYGGRGEGSLFSSSSARQAGGSSSSSYSSNSSVSGGASYGGGGFMRTSYSYSSSSGPRTVATVKKTTTTTTTTNRTSPPPPPAAPSYTVSQTDQNISSNTTLLTNSRLGIFQKVGKKLDRTIDRVKK